MAVTALSQERRCGSTSSASNSRVWRPRCSRKNADESKRDELKETLADLYAAHAEDDAERVLDAKNRFYAALSAGSGNAVLLEGDGGMLGRWEDEGSLPWSSLRGGERRPRRT
ncbi:FCD domain-containing protein [Mangrovicella endophytica]|uniref:FCD domain-containing protein n=1 Tax=Mangrovicella endophytica TaxID=2066697 RepID=UPI000DF13229